MADTAASENELATSTEQEMAVADESPEVIPEEKAAESTEAVEEVKEAAPEESSKANNEVEAEEPEEEEYVLKDEAHEEEDGQKEPETNGKLPGMISAYRLCDICDFLQWFGLIFAA